MATVATLQAEAMTSTAGYGASVVPDPTASGGKALLLDSAVTVRATVTLAAPASGLTVRAHTDGTTAVMVVTVDGTPFPATIAPAKAWADLKFNRTLGKGSHVVAIKFTNPESRNLLLDCVTFTGPTPPPPAETRLTAYVTGYGFPDNDPAYSDAIAHPTATRPAAGGSGTYTDPTTMAVGYTGSSPDLPYGTVFYIPTLRRYFRVEDLCGACHSKPRPPGTAIWLDLWVGGRDKSAAFVDGIAAQLTGAHTVIRNPAPNYVVAPGELAVTGVHLHGETPVLA